MASSIKSRLKKIADPKPCVSPEHLPPQHMVLEPGTYEYTCPVCGQVTVIRDQLTTLFEHLVLPPDLSIPGVKDDGLSFSDTRRRENERSKVFVSQKGLSVSVWMPWWGWLLWAVIIISWSWIF